MARIRQLHPQNYVSSSTIQAEFESVIRYLNTAEHGNKTIGELLAILFDENGEFDGPIEFRVDTTVGLQYRVGEYASTELGWQTIIPMDDLRGSSGINVGTIEGPLFYNRQDITATSGQTVFSYSFEDDTDDVMVFQNGVLLDDADYTKDSANDEITLDSGAALNDIITILSVRSQSVTNYRRSDLTAAAGQAVFPFAHTDTETLLVFKNGIVQRYGGTYDYTSDAASDTITMMSACSGGDVVTIITVQNDALQNVGGLMLEDEYTDSNGYILYSKLAVANDEIPQAKVNSLAAELAEKAIMTISLTAPTTPSQGQLWLDTSQNPMVIKFYDGTQWLLTSPDSLVPQFTTSEANYYLRINGTGTALEFGEIDFTSLIPKTWRGAANGVASLDSGGKLPVGQLPEIYSTNTITKNIDGSVTNGTYVIGQLFKQKVRLDGLAFTLSAGTCTIQLSVDGTVVGSTHSVSSTRDSSDVSPAVEIDATTAPKRLEVVVTSASSAADLEIGVASATIST